MRTTSKPLLAALSCSFLIAACGGGSDAPPPTGPKLEESRAHDTRVFSATSASANTFAALTASSDDVRDITNTSRWAGVLGGANYRVEVPAQWNGKLVMYAHGYAGTGSTLSVSNPSIRRYLIDNGYAWAASSYSKNFYDVRAGVEDTNALALEFNKIAAANGRPLSVPAKFYITGHSMGGHIAGAAIEDETAATAINKVKYNGAVPMCGVMGDTELFNTFAAMQVSAQAVAGAPNITPDKWQDVAGLVTNSLFSSFPTAANPNAQITPSAVGLKYASVLKNLTGGERPLFDLGLTFGGSFPAAYSVFGGDGTVNGILAKNILDTNAYTYVIDGDGAGTAALNASVQKLTAASDANRMRTDGLRWIPKLNGEFKVPVVSIHTLGDLFVPFNMQQIYQKRVAAKGNGGWLVQRAIRGASHCDFTVAEETSAFDAMIQWERDGTKPTGDDVITADVVAAADYGCAYTNDLLGLEESAVTKALRPTVAAYYGCGRP